MQNNTNPPSACQRTTLFAQMDIYFGPGKSGEIPPAWNQYIGLLEEPYCTWLRDHDISHLSYGAIARKYRRPVGTIKSSIWRGRRLLLILVAQQHLLSREPGISGERTS